MAAAFLADIDTVEDWGCGRGSFRQFCISPNYIGIDGSKTPFADKIVDLCTYKSTAPAILIRHVLEHNYNWEQIVSSAVRSFQNKLCLILFTPFATETKEIGHDKGIDVPDLSFTRQDIERHFSGFKWTLIKDIRRNPSTASNTFIWRGSLKYEICTLFTLCATRKRAQSPEASRIKPASILLSSGKRP
jgi:hypothetical protein